MPSCFSGMCNDLAKSSYITQKYETSFVASTKKGQKKEVIVKVGNSQGQLVPIRMIMDSITGESKMYWKIGEELKYGTMEDLFCSYIASNEKEKYRVLSVKTKKNTRNKRKLRFSANNIEPYFAPIKDVVYHGIKPVWKVTLRNGKTIEVTEDHGIFHNPKGTYQTELVSAPLNELKSVVSIDNYGFEGKKIPIENDMLTFMGLWMADGNYGRNYKRQVNGVYISTGDEPQVIQWLENFSIHLNVNGGGSCLKYVSKGDVAIHRTEFGNLLHSFFGDVDSYTKRVPKELFVATNEQIAAFLKGYFTGDGSVHICNDNPNRENFKYGSYYCVDCSSVNREMLEDIGILLDRLGIKFNITEGYKTSPNGSFKSDRLQYKLIIHAAPSVKKFVEKVGLIKKFQYKDRDSYQRDKKLRPVSLRYIRKIEFIGPKPVYDISVDETEAFIANGILCHNSGNDISILTAQTAKQLGLYNPNVGETISISGIAGGGQEFKMFPNWIQFGNMKPIQVKMGFALRDESLPVNLVGNKDILDSGHYTLIMDEDSIALHEKMPIGNIDMRYGGGNMQTDMVNYYTRYY